MDQVSAFWFHMDGMYEAKPCPCKSFNFCGEIGSFYIICLDFMFHRLFCPSRLWSLFGTDPCWSSCTCTFVYKPFFGTHPFLNHLVIPYSNAILLNITFLYNTMLTILWNQFIGVCFVNRCLSFCTFSFGHCGVCSSSIYWFWLPLWYLHTLLTYFMIWISIFDIYVNFNKYRERKDIDIMRHKRVMLFNSHWAVYQL